VVNVTECISGSSGYVKAVQDFFDEQYRRHERYWWKGSNRYALDPARHTPFNSEVLRLAIERAPGRVLDVGAGEGADAIRLAKLGYAVDAVELSSVACEKMEGFAGDEGVKINIINESALSADLEEAIYDVIVMNGSLHYIEDKVRLLRKMKQASTSRALHVMSLFSDATPVPAEHAMAPVFPDEERGVVEDFYRNDELLQLGYIRDKPERSHPGFAHHAHSFINQIVRLAERV
jgi:SAM-dependent methyltransferase